MRATSLGVLLLLGAANAFTNDYFFQICNSIIMTNDAVSGCTNGSRTLAALNTGQHECLCNSDAYLKSMYNCVEKAGSLAAVSNAAVQSWNALDASCRNFTGSPVAYDYDTMEYICDSNPVNVSFAVANATKQGAFTCPDEMLSKDVIRAGLAYNTNVYISNVYGGLTIAYVGAILTLQALGNAMQHFMPTLFGIMANSRLCRAWRKRIVLPALIGGRRAQPVSIPLKIAEWDLCIPPRMHSILMVGYIVLSWTLMLVRYDFVITEFSYSCKLEAVTKMIGYRSGYFAMYKLPLLVLFASKNNLFIWLTGWSWDTFNHWHRLLGRLFLLDVVVHAGCYSRWGQWAGVYVLKWQTFPPWIAAQIATICTGLMCLLGSKSIRKRCYEFFKATHFIMAVIMLVTVYVHISYFQLALAPFWVTVGLGLFDQVVCLLRVLMNSKASYAKVIECGDEIMKLDLNYPELWVPYGGSYIFVYFLNSWRFFQSHPFTVVRGADGRTQLYIKAREGRTRQLLEQIRASYEKSIYVPIWINGPYGYDFPKDHFHELVFFAGGVGITGAYSHLESCLKFGRRQMLYFYWVVPDVDYLETYYDLIQEMEKAPQVILKIFITRSSVDWKTSQTICMGRPDLDEIVENHMFNSAGPICYFVCGPAVMCDSIRGAVANNMDLTRYYSQFYEECFSM